MSIRKILCLSLVAALAAIGGQAQTTESSEQILRQVDTHLLAWDTAEARQALDTLAGAGGTAAKVASGRLLSQEGRLDEATAQLTAAVSEAPNDPSPAIYLGDTHRLANRSEEARQAFEMAVQRASAGLGSAPESVRMLVSLGVAKQKLRQLPEAIGALEKAHQLAPGNVEAAYQLGVTYAMAQRWGPAVDTLTKALNQNPEIAYAYYFRALSADKVDRKDLLLNDLKRFLALAPNAPDAPRAQSILNAIGG